jgi:hypothetical protein
MAEVVGVSKGETVVKGTFFLLEQLLRCLSRFRFCCIAVLSCCLAACFLEEITQGARTERAGESSTSIEELVTPAVATPEAVGSVGSPEWQFSACFLPDFLVSSSLMGVPLISIRLLGGGEVGSLEKEKLLLMVIKKIKRKKTVKKDVGNS